MPKKPNRPADDMPQVNEDGLIDDEYSDESLDDVDSLDALDVPAALRDESVLLEMSDDSDGIEELDLHSVRGTMDHDPDGTMRRKVVDDAEMGLASEPHTPEELADAAIGHELRGKGAVTRDDELHGERLFDRRGDEDESRP